jgi:hypothetical protein
MQANVACSLAIEPLNRFETDFINTVEQGMDLVGRIGASNVGFLLDTFHMNIEEKDIAAANVLTGAGTRTAPVGLTEYVTPVSVLSGSEPLQRNDTWCVV